MLRFARRLVTFSAALVTLLVFLIVVGALLPPMRLIAVIGTLFPGKTSAGEGITAARALSCPKTTLNAEMLHDVGAGGRTGPGI